MPHYAKSDVINRQNKQFKLKYLINKTSQRKSKKEMSCITVSNFTSYNNNFRVMGTLSTEYNFGLTSTVGICIKNVYNLAHAIIPQEPDVPD